MRKCANIILILSALCMVYPANAADLATIPLLPSLPLVKNPDYPPLQDLILKPKRGVSPDVPNVDGLSFQRLPFPEEAGVIQAKKNIENVETVLVAEEDVTKKSLEFDSRVPRNSEDIDLSDVQVEKNSIDNGKETFVQKIKKSQELVEPSIEVPSLGKTIEDFEEADELKNIFVSEGLAPLDVKDDVSILQPSIENKKQVKQLTSDQKRLSQIDQRVRKAEDFYSDKNDYLTADYINRKTYNEHNRHLPEVVYKTDYDQYAVAVSSQGDISALRALLNRGVHIDAVDENGNTLLMAAILNGHQNVVRLLLLRGADSNIANKKGVTALHVAVDNGRQSIFKELLYKNVNVNAASENGTTTLMRSIISRNVEMFNMLMDRKADPNIITKAGVSVLHIAAQTGIASIVNRLLKEGIEPNIKTGDGVSAEEIAIASGHMKIANIFSKSVMAIEQKRKAFELRRKQIIAEQAAAEKERLWLQAQEVAIAKKRKQLDIQEKALFEEQKKYQERKKNVKAKLNEPSLYLQYSSLTLNEKAVWNKRFDNWLKVDDIFVKLNTEQKTQWYEKYNQLKATFGERFFEKIVETRRDPNQVIQRWESLVQSGSNETASKEEKLTGIMSSWWDLDRGFKQYTLHDKKSANKIRHEMLLKIFGDNERSELSRAYLDLSEAERKKFQNSMVKWDDFEQFSAVRVGKTAGTKEKFGEIVPNAGGQLYFNEYSDTDELVCWNCPKH